MGDRITTVDELYALANTTHEALKAADVEGLIYIGCEDAGCNTASDKFYEMLASDWKCKKQVNPHTQWQKYDNEPVFCVFKR